MASTLKLEIVTPEAKVYSEEVDSVRLPGDEGELGIYPNHAPLMAQLKAGELIAHKGGEESILAVGHGFVEITGDHVAILTDNAADSADIDEAAAEEAKAKAQQRLEEGSDISEDEAKALAQAILYSEAQLKAKRHRG